MKKDITISNIRYRLRVGAVLLFIAVACNNGFAYQRYKNPSTGTGNCSSCHGDFTGATSPKGTVFPSASKHEMHRSSSDMNTTCNLCHTSGDTRNPFIGSSTGTANNVGLGCAGCHVGAGLRAHHEANGVTICLDCHNPETPSPENVKPPYFGTLDTRADNPCNGVALAKTNENWSIGDFEGLDNDGNNLYDMADSACGLSGMVVLPGGGLSSSGTVGGAFSPSSITYSLTNASGSSFNWTASKAQNWISLSATNGTLAAETSTNISVFLNTNATRLTAGSYSDTVGFTNTTSGSGNTSRTVGLTVNPSPGLLAVSPAGGLSSSGTVGGLFSPSSVAFTLTNAGGSSLNWTASKAQNWASLSTASGTLAAGASTVVTVSINANANSLTPGSYSDTVGFTNITSGAGNTSRSVSLTVTPSPGMLLVSPTGLVLSSGHLGGPFAPSNHVYTLTNSGGTALNWGASTPASWLSLSPSNSTLAPFASATVVAMFNTNAQILPSGSNYSQITFSTAGASSLVRDLALTIYPLPVWTTESQASNTTFQAQMQTVPDWTYFIEATTNLIDWTRMATNQTDGNGVLIFIDSEAAQVPRRFFRAVAAP